MRELRNSYASIIGWGIFLASALSLGSCSNNDTIDVLKGEAITFGNVFVEKSTRAIDPSYGAEKDIVQFQVWGTVTGNQNTVNVFNGAIVTKDDEYGKAWDCNVTQYWIPSTTYNFTAIANATSVALGENNMPTAIGYTADGASTYTTDGSKDLLLAELNDNGIKTVTTNADATPSQNPVAFTMSHLLSKAMFTFTNTDASATLTVSDIKMAGLNQKGTYTISGENKGWSSSDPYAADAPLAFGGDVTIETGEHNTGTSQYERLIIPGTYNITITFTVTDNKGGQAQDIEATIENQVFAIGNSYNFTADIKSGLTYIIFTIEQTDWTEGSDTPIQG